MRSVLITGAAAGIGRATVKLFLAQGWFVGAVDVDEVGLASLRQESQSPSLFTGVLDVGKTEQWAKVLTNFWEAAGGRLDALINNAGILSSGSFTDIPLARHHQIMRINVDGVVNGCYQAFPFLAKTPGSVVINLSSASAIYGQPGLATYSSSKFAVRGLTEALNIEWQPHGIVVRSIWPLFVQTGMVKGMDIASVKSMGIRLTAEDVATAILSAVESRAATPVHITVGWQTKIADWAAKLSPAWVNRAVNQWLAG